MGKLGLKLIGALVLIVIISVGLMILLTNASTESQFRHYLMQGEGNGMGQGGGYGQQAGFSEVQSKFLEDVNSSLVLAGLAGAAAALAIGSLLTGQIIKPLRKLTRGAQTLADGQLGHRVAVSSGDEIGELAESFNKMASYLEKSEQSRRRLINDIAHELRTPLTVIEGTVNGIIDGVFEPDQEHLGNIKGQSELLAQLINELKDISLAESGQLKLEITDVDVAEMIRQKVEQMGVMAREKGISLDAEVGKYSLEIKADSMRLEQIITNLLTNAIRHTAYGGKVTVSVGQAGLENGNKLPVSHLLLKVSDTGEGIPSKHLPFIFERFYRVQPSRGKSEGGTGLGLAIVKQMVEAHKGKVWAESQPGKGSTFYVALPLSK